MAENGAVVNTGHFDTSRIGNEKMLRAEKMRANDFKKLVDRVSSLEVVLEILLERSGISVQELVESNTKVSEGTGEEMNEIAGDTLTDEDTEETLTPVNVSEGDGFDPDKRRIIEDLTEEETTKEPVSV